MKKCKKCLKLKKLEEFPKHKYMKDGRLNVCKKCRKVYMKIYSKKYWKENLKNLKSYYSKYYKANFEKIKLVREQYQNTPKEKKKEKCRQQTRQLIRSGKLKRQPCEVCGARAELHHNNYNDIYDIKWLCKKHHRELHNKLIK